MQPCKLDLVISVASSQATSTSPTKRLHTQWDMGSHWGCYGSAVSLALSLSSECALRTRGETVAEEMIGSVSQRKKERTWVTTTQALGLFTRSMRKAKVRCLAHVSGVDMTVLLNTLIGWTKVLMGALRGTWVHCSICFTIYDGGKPCYSILYQRFSELHRRCI